MEDARIVELYWERDEAAIAESSAKYGGYCYQIAFRHPGPAGGRGGVRGRHLGCGPGRPCRPAAPGRLDTFLGKITRNLVPGPLAGPCGPRSGGRDRRNWR